MFVTTDYQQVVGEVKERNLFYKTLLEIKVIAADMSTSEDLKECKKQLQIILEKCEKAIENIV